MHLSRIQLNPQRRGAHQLLSNPQRMHAAVLSAFPDPVTGEQPEARILWRLDQEPHRLFLYIVSPTAPDLLHIAEQAGWPSTEPGESREYDGFLSRLRDGQVWRYRLTASPIRYLPTAGGGRARRAGHVTAAQQEAWLVGKSDEIGVRFSLDSKEPDQTLVTRRGTLSFRKKGNSRPVTITWAQFDGVLTVMDSDALASALVRGIGPGKAYGCGLLTLASAM